MSRERELVELHRQQRLGAGGGTLGTSGQNVSSPPHYIAKVDPLLAEVRRALTNGLGSGVESIECFVAMCSMYDTVDQLRGYLRGNSFKYRWRYGYKNGVEDLQKAQWYEERLLVLERTVNNHNGNSLMAELVAQQAGSEEYGG